MKKLTEPETLWQHLRLVWRVLVCTHWRDALIQHIEVSGGTLRVCTNCGMILEVVPEEVAGDDAAHECRAETGGAP